MDQPFPDRRVRRRRVVTALAIVLVLILIAVWSERRPIAADVLARTFAARDVPARYRVTQIGPRWQRIEDVVLGDPARPDLTADWIEVRLAPAWSGVKVTDVRASGLRLRARLADGSLSFGTVDRLLPKPGGAPFALPDIRADLRDAILTLATPYGGAAVRVNGRGKLSGGWAGDVVAAMPHLSTGSCRAERLRFAGKVQTTARSPRLIGPLSARRVVCGTTEAVAPRASVDAVLGPALDRWRGRAELRAGLVDAPGVVMRHLAGKGTFNGDRRATRGTLALTAATSKAMKHRIADASARVTYQVGAEGMRATGHVAAARLTVDPGWSEGLDRAAKATASLPVGPLVRQVAARAGAAGRAVKLDGDVVLTADGDGFAVRAGAVRAAGGGVTLDIVGPGIGWTSRGLDADASIRLAGEGLPQIHARLRGSRGSWRGLATVAPFAAQGARLDLTPVALSAEGGAVRVRTAARVSGPLGTGRIEGLSIPVDVSIGRAVSVGRGCIPVLFDAVAISSVRLGAGEARVCPLSGDRLITVSQDRVSGGFRAPALVLKGRLGASPLTLRSGAVTYAADANAFDAERLAIRLGEGERVTRLDVGRLSGRVGGALRGRFAGAAGQIGGVPLLLDRAAGDWRLAEGALELRGRMRVSDAAVAPRFLPMTADDVALRFAGNRIVAQGRLREPQSGAAVATVDLSHDLSLGTGRAVLDVQALRFGKALQPEALTPLTLGVVANVEGAVSGRGEIGWTPQETTSSGRFTTAGLDFAAAFGPVRQLAGTIVFKDLLGLVTPPGQTVTVASINPGTPVLGGTIRYHLDAGQRLVIEDGRWPFSGGILSLEPTTVELGQSKERRLTFRVDGLDAAQFVQRFEIDNLAATGIFDGTIPMVFDAQGGRIENGRLTVRDAGGTIAYVGDVSNAQMNMFAKLAFDALKSIRYRNLGIDLNGPLDGEMVSEIRFLGVNQRAIVPSDGVLVRQFLGLPFRFNITIRAPFRGLLSTARTFQDPSLLLKQIEPLPVPPGVQPPASKDRP